MAVFFAGRLIALLIIIVLLIVLLSAALFVVPQQQAYIIERFGKFLKVQFAGIHIRIPFVDRIAMKTNMRVNQLNVQLETKTLDNVFVTVVASTQFRVNPNDVATAYYELRDPAGQLRSIRVSLFRCGYFSRVLCKISTDLSGEQSSTKMYSMSSNVWANNDSAHRSIYSSTL